MSICSWKSCQCYLNVKHEYLGDFFMNVFFLQKLFNLTVCVWGQFSFHSFSVLLRTKIRLIMTSLVMDKLSSLVWNNFPWLTFFSPLYFGYLRSPQSWSICDIIGYWWCLLVSSRIHVACFVNKIWPFGMSAATIKKHCFVSVVDVFSFFSLFKNKIV